MWGYLRGPYSIFLPWKRPNRGGAHLAPSPCRGTSCRAGRRSFKRSPNVLEKSVKRLRVLGAQHGVAVAGRPGANLFQGLLGFGKRAPINDEVMPVGRLHFFAWPAPGAPVPSARHLHLIDIVGRQSAALHRHNFYLLALRHILLQHQIQL